LHDAPTSAEPYAGLGEAEFARGNYRAAQHSFQTAVRLAPNDVSSLQRLDTCNKLLTLDPTSRGLNQAERFRRSVKLLELTAAETSQCVGQRASPHLAELLDDAGRVVKVHGATSHQSELSESNLDLAERLWQARKRECSSPAATDSPVALVLAKLAQ
jgi:tetratricopeptide (TPR) repeat protein